MAQNHRQREKNRAERFDSRRQAFTIGRSNFAGERAAVIGDVTEKRRIARNERRVAVACTASPITAEEWLAICDKYDRKCLRCGSNGPLTMDHVVPVSRGGTNTKDNVQPLCRSCNSAKGTQIIDYR